MIQIDDAGWGCLIGGVLIGAYRPETDEFACGLIDVRFFQDPAFRGREYLAEGARIAQGLLSELSSPTDETVEVCTGHVLDGIKAMLQDEGRDWRAEKIEGPLQEKIETALVEHLAQIGFHIDYDTLTKTHGLAFYKAVEWLHGGNPYKKPRSVPEREALCKTGWGTFRVWADNPYNVAREKSKQIREERAMERREL